MEGRTESSPRSSQAVLLQWGAVSTIGLTTVLGSPTPMESALTVTSYYRVIEAHIFLEYNIRRSIA
jgi:hypothetical protein